MESTVGLFRTGVKIMEIRVDDIVGYYVDGKLYCTDCFNGETKNVGFLTKDKLDRENEEKIFVCDECKKIIDCT